METFAFIAAVATVLIVLHAVVGAYLYRVVRSGDEPTSLLDAETGERAPDPVERSTDPDAPADGTVSCPICGASNDPSYRFCRRCIADLTGRDSAGGGVPAGRLGS